MREKLDQLVAEMIERRIYLEEAVGEFEKKFIQLALKKTEGNQSTAAKLLGLPEKQVRMALGIAASRTGALRSIAG